MVQSVVIQSIGEAGPNVSGILSEAFGLPKEVFLKLLYQAPSVLFKEVDPPIAQQAHDLLSKLGLDVRVLDPEMPLPAAADTVEFAVYIPEVRDLPEVVRGMAVFMGCDPKTALNLLLKEPAIVLGGVSEATALALAKRIPAEITYTDPKNDRFWLRFLTSDASLQAKVFAAIPELKGGRWDDLSYEQCQQLWRKVPAEGVYELVNHSFDRFEIVLGGIDPALRDHWEPILLNEIGIPEAILPAILADLPVQLFESVGRAAMENCMARFAEAGLVCSVRQLPLGRYHIRIIQAGAEAKVKDLLRQFLPEGELPNGKFPWNSKTGVGNLQCRYMVSQLAAIGCVAEILEVENEN